MIYRPNKCIKLLSTTDKLYPVIHSGLGGCFEIAFYLTKKLKKNVSKFTPGGIIMCDGYVPYKDGERICCSYCGKLIDYITDKNGEYEVY